MFAFIRTLGSKQTGLGYDSNLQFTLVNIYTCVNQDGKWVFPFAKKDAGCQKIVGDKLLFFLHNNEILSDNSEPLLFPFINNWASIYICRTAYSAITGACFVHGQERTKEGKW